MQIVNVIKRYDSFTALNGVSLDIEDAFTIITGKSGSGKSTFLNILGGLDGKYEGDVIFNSQNINKMTEKEKCKYRNENIGFVFQQFNLESAFTVYDNVVLPALIGKKPVDKDKVLEILSLLDIKDKEKQKVKTLSGGEKQRVAIARALINDPEIILADEPTGNLDEENSRIVMETLKRISTMGKKVILVTHNLDDLIYGTRHIQLKDGEVVKDELL